MKRGVCNEEKVLYHSDLIIICISHLELLLSQETDSTDKKEHFILTNILYNLDSSIILVYQIFKVHFYLINTIL